MKVLTLYRFPSRPDGTFGALCDADANGIFPFCVTVERPWADNRPQESCIPLGEYLCKRVNSPKFGETFEITNVPGRTHILIHKGNYYTDSIGCLIVASQWEPINGVNAIQGSGNAFAEFMGRIGADNEFKLVIQAI